MTLSMCVKGQLMSALTRGSIERRLDLEGIYYDNVEGLSTRGAMKERVWTIEDEG